MDILITEEISSPVFDELAKRHAVVSDGTLWGDDGRLKEAIREARTKSRRYAVYVHIQNRDFPVRLLEIHETTPASSQVQAASLFSCRCFTTFFCCNFSLFFFITFRTTSHVTCSNRLVMSFTMRQFNNLNTSRCRNV